MGRKYFLYCMNGETNLQALIKNMQPELQPGEYVFSYVEDLSNINTGKIVALFKEKEAYTIIVEKHVAEEWKLPYQYVAAWITLTIQSSLEAVGLTAAFSTALANTGISCNVVAGYYHDHIFVALQDAEKAMEVLCKMAE
ncbi:MAG TPA: ACT domain-containing protein [Ferruginibacter sp.]|nr:ACT domain-containing protein [Ferruginibacter sp.]HPH93067.1 ACT domain-containing protein [Ferruginibacter sp.]